MLVFLQNSLKRFLSFVPNISVSAFKGFLSRAYKICSKRYIDEEIEFLIDVSTESGYERKTLEESRKNYLNELQNPSITHKDNREDNKKVVKLSWIPIIGPNLRQAFKKKNIKTIFPKHPPEVICENRCLESLFNKIAYLQLY